MKVGRIIFACLLTALCGFGWFSQIREIRETRQRLESEIISARQYAAQGLFQKSVLSYQRALSISEDGELRKEMEQVYADGYAAGAVTQSAYINALQNGCALYPEQAEDWERLVTIYRDARSYKDANRTLDQAEKAGAQSEVLNALALEIRYSHTSNGVAYTGVICSPGGYATTERGGKWGVFGPDGDRVKEQVYDYVSPWGASGIAVYRVDNATELIDKNGVVQAILPEPVIRARAYGDGLLPVETEAGWRYLVCEEGTWLPGIYKDATSFQNGRALVLQDGNWRFIDTGGNPLEGASFSDLRLFGNGEYSHDGHIAAAVEGKWRLYLADGSPVFERTLRNMDVDMGSYIAFQDDSGNWGYLDIQGNIVIQPQYREARSFSSGMGAVSNGERWGFINRAGKMADDYQYLEVGYFSPEGVCYVSEIEDLYHRIILRFPQAI